MRDGREDIDEECKTDRCLSATHGRFGFRESICGRARTDGDRESPREDQNSRDEGPAFAARRISVLPRSGSAFPIHGGAPKLRGIGRRQANLGQRGEDLVGWASGHLDRGRGHVHVLKRCMARLAKRSLLRTLPITAFSRATSRTFSQTWKVISPARLWTA